MAPKNQRQPQNQRQRRRQRKKQRDGLLTFTVFVLLLLFVSGAGYLLVNQSAIIRDVFQQRPTALADFGASDTPGLFDLLDREAQGDVDRLTFSQGGERSAERAAQLESILPQDDIQEIDLEPARELDLVRPDSWYEPYFAIIREQRWQDALPRLTQDSQNLYTSAQEWAQNTYENIIDSAKDLTPTDALRKIGEVSESVVSDIDLAESPPVLPEQVGPIDPSSYGGANSNNNNNLINTIPSPQLVAGSTINELILDNLEKAKEQKILDWPDPYIGLLSEIPVPGLIELTQAGVLPRVGANGQEPWRVYARAYNPLNNNPKVAFVVTNLGLGINETATAINLPGEITLAFAPYAPRLDLWTQNARENGHEFMLTLPMEPSDFPRSDPGPYGLLIELDESENLRRLQEVLSRTTGYVGLISFMGGRFTLDPTAVRPIIEELSQRGLLYLDTQSREISMASTAAGIFGMPNLNADMIIDAEITRQSFRLLKRNLLRIVKSRGEAVVVVQPYSRVLEMLSEWIVELQKEEVTLVPLTAIAIEKNGFY